VAVKKLTYEGDDGDPLYQKLVRDLKEEARILSRCGRKGRGGGRGSGVLLLEAAPPVCCAVTALLPSPPPPPPRHRRLKHPFIVLFLGAHFASPAQV
jgi:hypothetical protein